MLSRWQLVMYGITNTIGAGVFTMTGIGVQYTGSSLFISFLCAGVMCLLTSLIYAELCARFPINGSSFTYVYITCGEAAAWIAGWNNLPNFGATSAILARALTTYMTRFSQIYCGYKLPTYLTSIECMGIEDCNPMAFLFTVVICVLNTRSTETSA